MASKTVAQVLTVNGQTVTVAAADHIGIVRTAKDGHNRSIAKLDLAGLVELRDALDALIGMVSA